MSESFILASNLTEASFFPLFTHLTLNEIINTQSSEFPYRKWQSFLKLR